MNKDDSWRWPEVQYRRRQTRKGSLLETVLNIGSGFMLSWGMWTWVVAPLFGYATNMKSSLEITILFTVTSVVRSYLWRRGFERWLNRRTLMSGTRGAGRRGN